MATSRGQKRPYNAARRQEAAAETRRTIIATAREMFIARGYLATTMSAIAGAAGVALDTIYATVGSKPALFKLLVETALSGSDEPVPALERDYVAAVRAETKAKKKLALYASAICAIHMRLAPLFKCFRRRPPPIPRSERHLGDSGAFYVEYKQAVIRALTVPLPLMSALGVVALIVDGYGQWQVDGMAAPTWLTLTAVGLLLAGGVLTKAGHFPINDAIMTWKREAPPPTAAPGGFAGTGPSAGGNGSAAATLNGATGLFTAGNAAGGGGGGAGHIRINTQSGKAALTGTLSPAALTACMTEGAVH